MVTFIVQLVIVGMWSAMLLIHTRRLLRLAQVELVPFADHGDTHRR